mgnify:CR=1 FL=1
MANVSGGPVFGCGAGWKRLTPQVDQKKGAAAAEATAILRETIDACYASCTCLSLPTSSKSDTFFNIDIYMKLVYVLFATS